MGDGERLTKEEYPAKVELQHKKLYKQVIVFSILSVAVAGAFLIMMLSGTQAAVPTAIWWFLFSYEIPLIFNLCLYPFSNIYT